MKEYPSRRVAVFNLLLFGMGLAVIVLAVYGEYLTAFAFFVAAVVVLLERHRLTSGWVYIYCRKCKSRDNYHEDRVSRGGPDSDVYACPVCKTAESKTADNWLVVIDK